MNVRSTVNDWDRQVTGEPRAVYRPAGGLTPLLFAAREGCADCVDLLVNAGADIDYADPEAITPLLMAVMNMQFDTAAQLIRRGANPNKWDLWGRGPLYSSVDVNTLPRGGRPDLPSLDKTTSQQVIGMLLEAGAYPNQQLKMPPPFRNVGNDRGLDGMLTTGSTPLLRAAKALDAPAVKLLLDKNADITLTNSRGVTPTMAAAGLGSTDADTRGFYTSRGRAAALDRDAEAADRRRRRHQRQGQPRADAAARGGALGLERRGDVPGLAGREPRRQGQPRHDAGGFGDGPRRRQQPRRRAHRRPRRHRGTAQEADRVEAPGSAQVGAASNATAPK